jgi:hypothetical protein
MSDQPIAKAAIHTTHTKHKRLISMPSMGFQPTFPATKQQHNYTSDPTAKQIGANGDCVTEFRKE